MKRLLYTSIIIMGAACKREPLITYDVKDNIYFDNEVSTGYYMDSTDFTFAYSDAAVRDTILYVPLGVTGSPAATDRHYQVVADPASTAVAGTHYQLADFVFHAGKVTDSLPVRLLRSPDLATSTKKLILRLQQSGDFQTDLQYRIMTTSTIDTSAMLTFTISMSDILTAGPYWDDVYSIYFGTFSLKKVMLIHDQLGMPLNFWSVASPTNQQRAQAIYYASLTSRYLADQANQGNIILDEDGTPMKMGTTYQ